MAESIGRRSMCTLFAPLFRGLREREISGWGGRSEHVGSRRLGAGARKKVVTDEDTREREHRSSLVYLFFLHLYVLA